MLEQIGPNSHWINRIADLIDSKPNVPGFTFKSLGIEGDYFPRHLFNKTKGLIEPEQALTPSEDIERNLTTLKNNVEQMSENHLEQLIELSCELEVQLKTENE